MATHRQITDELAALPEDKLEAVLNFIQLVKSQAAEPAILSEPALARDWSTPEEDAAWADL